VRRERFAIERGEVDLPGGFDRMRLVVQRPAPLQHLMGDGAICQARIEKRQMVIIGDTARERALAGCGGTIDGDNHRSAPYRRTRSAIPGLA
jgi:hypothetical protein